MNRDTVQAALWSLRALKREAVREAMAMTALGHVAADRWARQADMLGRALELVRDATAEQVSDPAAGLDPNLTSKAGQAKTTGSEESQG